MTSTRSQISFDLIPIARAGGLFVSPGHGRHADRTIESWEIIFVRSGCLHIELGGVEFRVSAGESLVLSPHVRHRGLSDYGDDVSYYWVHFRLSKGRLRRQIVVARHGRPARPANVAELCHRYIADQTAGTLQPAAADALIVLLWAEMSTLRVPGGRDRPHGVVRTAEELIHKRLRHGTSPGAIAEQLGYSTAHLSRLLRRQLGVTLGGLIRRIQIAEARSLLQDTALPLKTVAAQCGYRGVSYFRRTFRKEMGLTPRAYRGQFGRVRINRQ